MNQQTSHLSILFADISKSSVIYEQLGDQAAQKTVGKILQLLSDLSSRHEGKVVKTVGDAVIATFVAANNAIAAAQSMQQAMTNDFSSPSGLPPIHIHIGIHCGLVVMENEDVFGDAVNIAARVVDYANPRQIVATRSIIDNLSDDAPYTIQYITKITAKNIAGELELFEIVYEDQIMTTVIDCRKLSKVVHDSLYLTRGTEITVVDRQNPVVSIGREDFNDISIHYSWISRTHAYIENCNGIFLLRDKSTNGTFIYPEKGESVYVNKGEHPLAGKGIITFGREKETEMGGGLSDIMAYEIR